MVEFFKWWKYPSNSSETFKILFFHQNNQFEAKTECFVDFSILTKVAVSGHYRCGHFVGWFFWLSFSIGENTLRILLKYSKFCSFIKTISLKEKQHVLRTFQFWPKSLYPDLTGVAIFSIDFLKCWKYHSNSAETFKMLFFHQNNQFEAKTACFADFSILTKIAVSGPYRRGHFVSWFFGCIFQMLKIPFEFFWNIQNFVLSSKQPVWSKNSMFCGLFNFAKVAVSGPYRCGHFVGWFFGWVFQLVKIPLEFFWNIPNLVPSSKQSVWRKNSMFCGLFNFDQNRCIRTLPAWPFFPLIFWNVENTIPILLKHSKCCSFIKTISLKQKQHVLQTFQFWPKSLYLDLTCVAILLVDFFGCIFQMLKIPFEFFWDIQNFVFHQNNQFEAKTACFVDFSILPKSLYPDLTGVGILLVDFLVEFFNWWKYLSNSFEILKPNFVPSSKQSVWRKNSMFCGLFNFDQNRCIRTLPAWPFFSLIFWNVENQFEAKTIPIVLKHSKCSSFIKTISLKQKQHVLQTFQFWPKSLHPDLPAWTFCLLISVVVFFKCWKYPSNSSETFKILFFHQNNQFEAKTACFVDFSILTKIAVSGPYRRGNFVGWFFWLYFSNVENTLRILLKLSKFCSFIKTTSLKQKQHVLWTFQFWPKSLFSDLTGVAFCWLIFWLKIPFQYLSFSIVENTLRILLKHSKCCSFIKTISLKQKQHVLRTFQFWPKSLYPDLTGVAILLVDFFGCIFQMLKIPFEFFWNIQNFVLSSKQPVWSKNSMFCGLFNFDQNRCIRTLPAWQFYWLIFLVVFFKCWKYPSNSSETFKILFFHQNNQFEAKTACFLDFSILTKIAVFGPYRRGNFVGWFFGWVFQLLKIPFEFFWNIQNFVLSSKQSFWRKNSMFYGLLNFDQNRCIRTLPAWPFC